MNPTDRRKAETREADARARVREINARICAACGKTRGEHVQVVVGGRDDCCQRDVLPTQEGTFFRA